MDACSDQISRTWVIWSSHSTLVEDSGHCSSGSWCFQWQKAFILTGWSVQDSQHAINRGGLWARCDQFVANQRSCRAYQGCVRWTREYRCGTRPEWMTTLWSGIMEHRCVLVLGPPEYCTPIHPISNSAWRWRKMPTFPSLTSTSTYSPHHGSWTGYSWTAWPLNMQALHSFVERQESLSQQQCITSQKSWTLKQTSI